MYQLMSPYCTAAPLPFRLLGCLQTLLGLYRQMINSLDQKKIQQNVATTTVMAFKQTIADQKAYRYIQRFSELNGPTRIKQELEYLITTNISDQSSNLAWRLTTLKEHKGPKTLCKINCLMKEIVSTLPLHS
jgi:hypothetical protein